MTKQERLNQACQYLRYRGLITSQRDLANQMNAAETNVSSALKGAEKSLTNNFLKRFNSTFKNIFNIKWLILGEGDMLNVAEESSGKTIKYYPEVEGTAGGVQFLENPNERSIDISIPFCTDCTCAINVHGDSMAPRIKSGQVVLLSEWTESFIDWGKIYLVVTRNGYRCIKYLFPSADKGCITCRSENSEENPDFDINKEDIIRLFIVKGWICRDAI